MHDARAVGAMGGKASQAPQTKLNLNDCEGSIPSIPMQRQKELSSLPTFHREGNDRGRYGKGSVKETTRSTQITNPELTQGE
jgi:hypothetical protein